MHLRVAIPGFKLEHAKFSWPVDPAGCCFCKMCGWTSWWPFIKSQEILVSQSSVST